MARISVGCAVTCGALVVSGLVAPAAPADDLACGSTVTHDVTLRHDLVNCTGDGLVAGSDGITIDLAGHTIDGDAAIGGDDTGVRLNGRRKVTVRSGRIQEFDHAVHLSGASDNHITGLVATRSGDADIGRAILLDEASDGNQIDNNDASFNGRSGVAVLDSSRNLITGNRTNHNAVAGMGVFGGSDNRVVGNIMTDNNGNGIFWGAGHTGGVLAGNMIARNPEAGIEMDEADDATVAFNRLDGNAYNLIVFGNRNRITANAVADAPDCADGSCGYGISLEGGTGNQVIANVVHGGAHDGIRLDTFAPDDLPLADTLVLGNTVHGAAIDGISVGTETDNAVPGVRIEANRASGNGDDGIDARRPGTTLRANVVDRNGDLGISAVAGAIDGGANRARGNGNPAQCLGVACG